jgi:hypothetical protein
MTLLEIIERLDSFDSSLTIYADPGADPTKPTSTAVLAYEPEDGSIPEEAQAMTYFLEVYLAKEIVEDFEQANPNASTLNKCQRVIHYAIYDA